MSGLLERAQQALAERPSAALRLAQRAVAAAPDDPQVWRLQGQALRALGRHADALAALERAADCARAADDPLLAARVQLGAIDSLGMLGRHAEGIARAQSLEATFRESGAHLDAAKALCNRGSLYLRTDRYAEALRCYERAETDFLDQPRMRAMVQVNQAIALTYLNDTPAAIARYDAAGAVYRELGLSADAAIVETNVGFLHHVRGEHAAAIACFQRARPVFLRQERLQDAARCEIDGGDAYRALNLLPEAGECYERARAILERLPLDYDRGRAELGRGVVLLGLGRDAEAAEALAQAESLFGAQRNPIQRAHVRLVRASALLAAGQGDAAAGLAQAAARSFSRRKLRGWAAEARFVQAQAQPVPDVRRLSAIVRTARAEGRGWLECRAERALGRHGAERGQTARALRHLRRGAAALESLRARIAPETLHTAFLNDKQAIWTDLVEALLRRGRPADWIEALETVERSRSHLLLERALSRFPTAPAPLAARLERLRAALSQAYRPATVLDADDSRRFVAPSPASLAAQEREYLEALREAEMAQRSALGPRRAATWPEMQAELQDDETLLVYAALSETVCAFVVRRDGITVVPDLARCADVQQELQRFRYHLQKRQSPAPLLAPLETALKTEMDGVLARLYDLLLRPLETSLAAPKLSVIPQGFLHGLPFHALYEGRVYATDRWEIAYAPSASLWRHARRPVPAPRGPALLVGVPSPGIERVALEVERLARLLPGARTLCGAEATIEAVRGALPGVSTLHLATHARFRADNPLFSGLQLADGSLLARDLYDLALPGARVTLSACETAVSQVEPGDELFGLVRGFLAAGARTVLASLWPADDEATAALMGAYYAHRQAGGSDGAALRQAQRQVRRTHPHPYHWAAFCLVGNAEGGTK